MRRRVVTTSVFRTWSLRHIIVGLKRTMLAAVGVVYLIQNQTIAHGREPVSSSTPRGAATVAALQVIPGEVVLSLSAPVEVHRDYLRSHDRKADRCYVDLSPASFVSQSHSVFDLSTGPIQKVRISQFHESVVRVVLDLRGSHTCQVTSSAEPHRLILTAGGAYVAQPTMNEPTVVQPPPRIQEPEESSPQEAVGSTAALPVMTWQIAQRWTLFTPEPEEASSPVVIAPATGEVRNSDFPDDQAPSTVPSNEPNLESAPSAQPLPPFVPEMVAPVKQLSASEALASPAFPQESTRIGGEIVREFWMIMMGASILLSFLAGGGMMFLWNARNRGVQSEKNAKSVNNDGWEARMAYLEEAVNRAGMLNSSFFHSLEITQKRLEALLTQADLAEQNLRRLLHQAAMAEGKSTGRNTDSYVTAASLLAEGEDVQQVARVLKLPVAQVRLLQELRKSTQGEKLATVPEKSAETQSGHRLVTGLKSFVTQLNGAPRDGMPLAQR
jgi:hypothetical protein